MRPPLVAILLLSTVGSGCGTSGSNDGGSGQNDLPPVFDGWAVRAGGVEPDAGRGVAVFPDGSSVVVGVFRGQATFGEGEPNETTLVALGLIDDIFVARYAADGTLVWARREGSLNHDHAADVDVVPDGSCVVTGSYTYQAIFGEGEPNETTLMTQGLSTSATFVARYSEGGALLWAATAIGSSSNGAVGIGSLPDGSCVVTGTYVDSVTFAFGEPFQATLQNLGGSAIRQMFVARYAADGAFVWVREGETTFDVIPLGLDTLADGSSFVTGRLEGVLSLGVGPDRNQVQAATENASMFLLRYDGDGVPQWAVTAGHPTGSSQGNDVAVLSNGTSVITGLYYDMASFGGGGPNENETVLYSSGDSTDSFVARYGSTGSLVWATRAGGTAYDRGERIAVHADGSIYVAGKFGGTATFGLTETYETALTAAGSSDVFVARFVYSDGTLRWARQAGGPGSDVAGGIAARSDYSCVVTGAFEDVAEFGTGVFGETLTSDGESEIFLARYGPNGEL